MRFLFQKVEFFGIGKSRILNLKNQTFFRYVAKKKIVFSFEERKIIFNREVFYKYLTNNLSIRKYCEKGVKFFLSLSLLPSLFLFTFFGNP
jgi:hypothetical protein